MKDKDHLHERRKWHFDWFVGWLSKRGCTVLDSQVVLLCTAGKAVSVPLCEDKHVSQTQQEGALRQKMGLVTLGEASDVTTCQCINGVSIFTSLYLFIFYFPPLSFLTGMGFGPALLRHLSWNGAVQERRSLETVQPRHSAVLEENYESGVQRGKQCRPDL